MKFSEKIMIFWVMINIVLTPLAFADAHEVVKQEVSEEVNVLGNFGNIVPHEQDMGFYLTGGKIFFVLLALAGLSVFLPGKKGQITLFMMLFVVVIAVFGFLFYITNKAKSGGVEQEVDKTIQDYFKATNFNVYMQSCLDKIGEDAIELLGKQGGFIYKDYPNDKTHLLYYDYGEDRPQIDSAIRGDNFSLYGPHVSNTYCGSFNICNFFGTNSVIYKEPDTGSFTVPYLLKKTGRMGRSYPYENNLRKPTPVESLKNSLAQRLLKQTRICSETDDAYFETKGIYMSCPNIGLDPNQYSVQDKLNDFMESHMEDCFYRTNFYDTNLAANMEPLFFQAEYHTLIGENQTYFYLDIPLNISLEEGTYTRLLSFTSSHNVRLKKVYDVVEAVANAESSDIFFRLRNMDLRTQDFCNKFINYSGDTYARNETDFCKGLVFEVVRDYADWVDNGETPNCLHSPYAGRDPTDEEVAHCRSATIIKIRDTESIINSKPFEFWLAVENRNPALDWISLRNNNSFYNRYIYETYGNDNTENNVRELYNHSIGTYYVEGRDKDKDIIVKTGEEIRIIPFAIDPDDPYSNATHNNINYTYAGWKSNVSLDFELSSLPTYENLTSDPYNASVTSANELLIVNESSPSNIWQESTFYQGDYKMFGWVFDSVVLYDKRMNYLTESVMQDHSFIGKDGNYTTNSSDVGYHVVRVYARDMDEPWLYDYQDIFIQVRCRPNDDLCCGKNTTDYHYKKDSVQYCGEDPSNFDSSVDHDKVNNLKDKECTYRGCCNMSAGYPTDCEYNRTYYYHP